MTLKPADFDMRGGSKEWQKMMRHMAPRSPEMPAYEQLTKKDIKALLQAINSTGKSLGLPDLVTPQHNPEDIREALNELAKNGKIRRIGRTRGRYVSHKIYDQWDKQRKFEEAQK